MGLGNTVDSSIVPRAVAVVYTFGMLRWSLLVALGSLLIACEDAPQDTPAAQTQAQVQAATEVGYDLRRLRPRDEEPLAKMFDRMAAAAHAEGKQVAVLFSADWCEPCRRLELEFGNVHPPEKIGKFRIFELKEEDWDGAMRIGEFNELRRRWYPAIGSYPVFIVLDENSLKVEEMKEAIARLKGEGVDPTVDNWLHDIAGGGGPKASAAG